MKREYVPLIFTVSMVVAVFLPWIVLHLQMAGYATSASRSGIPTVEGIFALIIVLGGGFLAYGRHKFTAAVGALDFLLGIIAVFHYDLGAGYRAFGQAAGTAGDLTFAGGASVSIGWGLWVFLIASVVFTVLTWKYMRPSVTVGQDER